jgi:hypothetical protein
MNLLELDLAAILRTTKLPMAVADGLLRLIQKGGSKDDCALMKAMMADNGWTLHLKENTGYGIGDSEGYKGEPEITRFEGKSVTLIWI